MDADLDLLVEVAFVKCLYCNSPIPTVKNQAPTIHHAFT